MTVLELEAPSPESLDSHAARATAAGLHIVKPEAEAAVHLLDADATGDEQREGSTPIVIRLVRPVEDPVSAFFGAAGANFNAYTDTGGNTWLPRPDGDICLEAEEFEVVEPLASQDETIPPITETIPPVAETIQPAVETPTTAEATPPPAVETVETPQSSPTRVATHWGEYARRRADYLHTKDVLQEQISALMIEQAKLKEQAKRCKKEAEVYIEQLNELIENWENPAPLADANMSTETAGECGVPHADQAAVTQPEPASQPGEPQETAPVQSEAETAKQYEAALRAVTIESLGVGGKLLEKLTEERVTTIWDWEDLRKEIGLGRKEWPRGVGEKKQEDINTRISDWVAKDSHRWTQAGSVQAANDAVEERQDAERAADVAESQSTAVATAATSPAISTDIEDL